MWYQNVIKIISLNHLRAYWKQQRKGSINLKDQWKVPTPKHKDTKKVKKAKQRTQELWINIKWPNMFIIGVKRGK